MIGHASAGAQTLYGIDGNVPGPSPIIHEYTGPPNPAFCSYPNGPLLSSFPAVGGVICPGLLPFPLVPGGDITVDTVTDQVYAADGPTIARYSSNGAVIDSFPSPIAVVGMGFDPLAPLCWITDGALYGAITPPVVPACPAGVPPPFAIGPFPVPIGAGFFAGPITDIDWDAATGTLMACDVTGIVGNFLVGVAAPGPYGFFPVAPAGFCAGLTPALTGIAIDNSVPGTGTFYVTDGLTVAYLVPGGGPAPLTFYTTANCFAVPTASISGLAFASRPIRYGVGTDSTGLAGPTIGSIGQSIVPSPGFVVTLSGAVPGSMARLYASFVAGPLCPPLPVAGVLVHIGAPLTLLGVTTVDAAGNAFLSAPIAPGTPTGLSAWLQWAVFTPVPSIQASDAAEATTALP